MATNYGERIARMEEKLEAVGEDIAEIKTLLKSQDDKFAAKWVQTVVGGLIGLVLTSVGAALLALVIRKG